MNTPVLERSIRKSTLRADALASINRARLMRSNLESHRAELDAFVAEMKADTEEFSAEEVAEVESVSNLLSSVLVHLESIDPQ